MKYTRGRHPNSRKNSPFIKGHVVNIGRICKDETKQKIKKSRLGMPSGMLGKKQSEETKEKISVANKGKKHLSHVGKKHYNYKHGLSKTREFRAFVERRRKARKKNNGGLHTLEQWENLKRDCQYMCLCCKRSEPEITLTEDHIFPISKGGSDDISNIQPLCRACNQRKNAKTIKYV